VSVSGPWQSLGREAGSLGSAEGARSFLGGYRLGTLNATWPFVRLSLFRDSLRLEPSLRQFPIRLPLWEARYSELIEAQPVGRVPLLSTGVRFRTTGNEWIVFWTAHRGRVMAAVASHGVKVVPTPVRFRRHPEL